MEKDKTKTDEAEAEDMEADKVENDGEHDGEPDGVNDGATTGGYVSRRSRTSDDQRVHYCDVKDDIRHFLIKRARETAEIIEHSEMLHVSMVTAAGSKWPQPEDNPKDEVEDTRPRGLQAFDVALNPEVEALMRAARYGPRFWAAKKADSKRESEQGKVASRPSNVMASLSTDESFARFARPSVTRRRRRFHFESQNKVDLKDEGPIEIPWLNERLATSCRSCRFELPMDILEMKKMSVTEYLLKYCKIPPYRRSFYKKLFDSKADKATGLLPFKDLERSLCTRVLANSVGEQDLVRLFRALNLKEDSFVNLKLFCVICVLAERILYVSQVGRIGQVGVSRGFLECADFCALDWKLRGVEIDPYLRNLLYSLG